MNQKPTPYGNGNSIKKRINNNRDAGWKLCKLHETTIFLKKKTLQVKTNPIWNSV
jgi:hypothetical protein